MPIVNPWLFYMADLVNSLNCASFCVSMFSIFAFFVFLVCYIDNKDEFSLKWLKRSVAIFCSAAILLVLLPSKETVYKMYLAKMITHERVDNTLEAIKENTNVIIKSIDKSVKEIIREAKK